MKLDAFQSFARPVTEIRFRDDPAEPSICQTIALEAVNTTFYNAAQSFTAYCPDGYEGEPVTVTKDAGSYSSAVSKADADAQALAAAEDEATDALSCSVIT
jgi:hypothetical protein